MVCQILVIGANAPYDFTDPQTKRQVQGRTVHYIMRDLPETAPAAGFVPTSQAMALDAAADLQQVPGIYEGRFQLRNVQGKAVLKLAGLKFVAPVKL